MTAIETALAAFILALFLAFFTLGTLVVVTAEQQGADTTHYHRQLLQLRK